ncbi:Homeobox protein Hox-A5 [Pitangus sulphuratus]|nr:Homeobox protein Hox-A5 [Pitangus sulphuratus]
MHSGRYGYGYNGMDLSVGRSASTHFGANERPRSYPANTTSASTEPRYNQPATSSHSPPPDPLPCTAVAGSPVSESHHGVKNSLANSTSTSSNSSSNTHISRDGVGTSSGTEEDTPASSEQASAPTDQSTAQPSQPQIYPWMRKLHISHGYVCLLAIQIVRFRDRSIQTTSSQYYMKNGSLQVKGMIELEA